MRCILGMDSLGMLWMTMVAWSWCLKSCVDIMGDETHVLARIACRLDRPQDRS